MTKPMILAADGSPMRQSVPIPNTGTSAELAGWRPMAKSADAALLPKLLKNKGRSRDLFTGNGYAKGGIYRKADSVIGTGLRLDYQPVARLLGPKVKDGALQDFVAEVEERYELYTKDRLYGADVRGEKTLGGLSFVQFMHHLIDGRAVALFRWMKDRPRREIQTAVQLVHPDRLSNPQGRTHEGTIREGVERDDLGRAVACYIRDKHPSDGVLGVRSQHRWERVPMFVPGTRRRQVMLYYAQSAAEQTHGEGVLNAVLEKFKKVDILQDTSLGAGIINSMFGFFITSPFDHDLIGDQMPGVNVGPSTGGLSEYQQLRKEFHNERQIRLGGVNPLLLAPGEEPKSLDANRPSPEYAGFVLSFLEEMATAQGMSVEQYTHNWSRTNYSSMRGAMNETWKTVMRERLDFAGGFDSLVFELFLEEIIDKGIVRLPEGAVGFYDARSAWCNHGWIGPGRGIIDGVKEETASEMRVENGRSSLKDECAEQGRDYRKVLEQRKREKAEFEAAGLAYPGDADRRAVTIQEEKET